MNKYELAVVVSAKLEDDDRAATIERVKKTGREIEYAPVRPKIKAGCRVGEL